MERDAWARLALVECFSLVLHYRSLTHRSNLRKEPGRIPGEGRESGEWDTVVCLIHLPPPSFLFCYLYIPRALFVCCEDTSVKELLLIRMIVPVLEKNPSLSKPPSLITFPPYSFHRLFLVRSRTPLASLHHRRRHGRWPCCGQPVPA